MRLIEVLDEHTHLLEKRVGTRGEAEQLRQLADDDRDAEAVHVSDLHLLGEQVGDETEFSKPEPNLGEADEHRQHARQRDRGLGVAAREQRRYRGQDQRGDRRVGPEDQHPRGAEHRVADQARDRRVKTRDRRKPGELGVRHALRDEDRGEDDPGEEVRSQPRALIGTRGANAWHPAFGRRCELRRATAHRSSAGPRYPRGEQAGRKTHRRARLGSRSEHRCAHGSTRRRPPAERSPAPIAAARRTRRWRTRPRRRCDPRGTMLTAACGSASGAIAGMDGACARAAWRGRSPRPRRSRSRRSRCQRPCAPLGLRRRRSRPRSEAKAGSSSPPV